MTNFIQRLRERMDSAQGLSYAHLTGERPRKVERGRNLVKTNRWDDKTWQAARKTKTIDDLVEDLDQGDDHKGGERQPYEYAPELVEGIYHQFFKANPTMTPKRELERELYPARKFLDEIREHPRLKDLQDMTIGDPVLASVAVDSMGDVIREFLTRTQEVEQPDPNACQGGGGGGGQGGGGGNAGGSKGQKSEKKEKTGPPEKGENTDGGGNAGEGGKSDGSSDGAGGDEDEELTGEGDSDFEAGSEDAEGQAEAEWESQFDDALDGVDLDRLAHEALNAAFNEVDEIEGLRKGIGLEDGEWYSMNPESRMAMADQLRTEEMKELAEVIGRMKRFALGVKATRIIDVPHEAYDVEYGNDLRRLLRPQYALLGNEFTKYEFFRRYTDKELLVYKMRGKEDVGKGPIVIAIDKSGSMGGAPFRWAMGVAEALRRFAAEEDRDYYAMFFGNNNDRERFDFPGGKGPFDKVLSFLGTQANGGTEFDGVLTEALEKASVSFDGEGKGKADIVFITDGMAHLDEKWIADFNAERNRVGVRVYSVYIGGAYDTRYHEGPLKLLEGISDATIPVAELKPESVQAVFERV